jgi:hypothetical protein
MSNTVDRIRELSNDAASKKIAEEQQRTVERVNEEIVIIEKILAMVKDLQKIAYLYKIPMIKLIPGTDLIDGPKK